MRDPPVLILDEATSALDPTSRILVFEALKRWRANKTTIVITHDLSQIGSGDFVYVMQGGRVVEQGYRGDLEALGLARGGEKTRAGNGVGNGIGIGGGLFAEMVRAQEACGGYLPEKPAAAGVQGEEEEKEERAMRVVREGEEEREREKERQGMRRDTLPRPLTMGNWMFDVVADLTSISPKDVVHASRVVPPSAFTAAPYPTEVELEEVGVGPTPHSAGRRSSLDLGGLAGLATCAPFSPVSARTVVGRRRSLQFEPTSPQSPGGWSFRTGSTSTVVLGREEDYGVEGEDLGDLGEWREQAVLQKVASEASLKRKGAGVGPRVRLDAEKRKAALSGVAVVEPSTAAVDATTKSDELSRNDMAATQSFTSLLREIFTTIPCKPVLLLGLLICGISGATTPIFSFFLSRLMVTVSSGATSAHTVNIIGGAVLGVAALDGACYGLKYALMEYVGVAWITRLRMYAASKVFAQDKAWFDKSENAPPRLVQVLVQDADDAKNLIAVALSQTVVVCSMLGVGLIWALVKGWQLTLVGFAVAPLFAVTMSVQNRLVAKCELRNKRAREEVAKGYYDAISNIKAIRYMSFESVFKRQFEDAADRALATGMRGAFVEGCTYGLASAIIYFAEGLLFYTGALLIARGTYTYLQLVEVLNLVVFTVTLGSQLMGFTQKIAKAVAATRDINQLIKLSTDTEESHGTLRPPITGHVSFHNVRFAYPERANVPVLKDISVDIADGECVAIVGSSGSGKSTIATLLQRLYEPQAGTITVGHTNLRAIDVQYLRDNVAVVSQNPNLFDATITENIAYGNLELSEEAVQQAAKAANVHDFITSLPQGYDTMVGENASLISAGQAQRLQIARALVRPSRILILDECTSALDPANQSAVLETIRLAKVGRTTLMVTHKLPVMRMCDRIVVVHEGEVAEQGTYDELVARKGVFATLASGGEWQSE